MLKSLSIRNIALIERADLCFDEGINVLSGETGAGKSVILESIDFVLGAKADKSMIRHGESECSVRAEFFTRDPEIMKTLEELDIEPEENLVISRRLTADGRGGAKLNGCAVAFSMLKKVTSRLVDVHGQSEHFFLLKESNQLRLLDRIVGDGLKPVKAEISKLLARRKELFSQLSLLGGDEAEKSRRLDILGFQIDEIKRAAIREGEEEELSALKEKYVNTERISLGLNAALEAMTADGAATDCIRAAKKSLGSIGRYGEEYESLARRLESALDELGDISQEMEGLGEELEFDEGELERTEARLDEIRSLKKKYGATLAEINAFSASAEREFELLKDSGARREALLKELEESGRALYAACRDLTELRRKAAEGFSERVVSELRTLNITSARFEVEFEDYALEDVERATSEGLGGVKFLFSANAGEPLKELGKIISGGEMSRFMLAIKAQLTALGEIGTYIFDEIDAGIGGRTARVVAEKFCSIARNTQIIAVSHLAQIASCADRQFLIEKTESDGRAKTEVRELSLSERRTELARLIAGDGSELALRQAEEFLKGSAQYKETLRQTEGTGK